MSAYDGAFPLEHAGRRVALRFDWAAVAALQADWGHEAYAHRVGEAIRLRLVPDVAELVARASGMSVAEVMAWSPPMAVAVDEALKPAWLAFWLGPEGAREAEQEGADTGPLAMIQSWLRLMPIFAQAGTGKTSGGSPPGKPVASSKPTSPTDRTTTSV